MSAAHRACLAPAAADEWAAPDAVRLDVLAKCRAVARDSLSAKDLDFPKAAAARLAASGRRGARERFPARQQLVALQKAVYSRVPQQRAEPVRLRAVKPELRDEWVSPQQAQRASRLSERLQAPALAP